MKIKIRERRQFCLDENEYYRRSSDNLCLLIMLKDFLLELPVVGAVIIGVFGCLVLELYFRKSSKQIEDEELLVAIDDFSNSAVKRGQQWCNKLVATDVIGMNNSNENLQIDTKYGKIRFCGPVTVIARTPSGQVIANSAEMLQNNLHLPISGHSLNHWFVNSGSGTVEGGGGPTPKIKIVSCKFNRDIVVTGRLTYKIWEPHLSGDFEMEMNWTSQSRLNRGLLLPTELEIHLSTKFGKLMWNCDIPRLERFGSHA
jgi:hypothetical protein